MPVPLLILRCRRNGNEQGGKLLPLAALVFPYEGVMLMRRPSS